MSVVVTAGNKFLDIDAYAGCIAYAELLNLQGIDALAASSAAPNESVTTSARQYGAERFQYGYKPSTDDNFVLIDVSEPEFIDPIVSLERVERVLDHHPGFEDFWHERTRDSIIDFIGAACTIVFEEWQKSGFLDQMSAESAKLLSLGILDNTLNFNASVMDQRDIDAYDQLKTMLGLDDSWIAEYFSDCQQAITSDLENALENDTKVMHFPGHEQAMTIGQLVVWDAGTLIDQLVSKLDNHDYILNIVSVSEGTSTFLAGDESVQKYFEPLIGTSFHGGVAKCNRMWLRKELAKTARDLHS